MHCASTTPSHPVRQLPLATSAQHMGTERGQARTHTIHPLHALRKRIMLAIVHLRIEEEREQGTNAICAALAPTRDTQITREAARTYK